MSYGFDSVSNTNYTIFRINRERNDGSKQFPFVRYYSARTTAKQLSELEGWNFVINAGIGEGLIIQDSTVITDTAASAQAGVLPLTIDADGMLGYTAADTTGHGSEYIQQGIVSAVCGFYPVIVDYENYDYPTDIPDTSSTTWQYAQRQVIGQFGNGDYAILTCSGRGFDNSTGWTMADVQRICKSIGLKFAYNLDGGGSTQTVIENRQVNMVYEGTSGRLRTLFIVFNGTDEYNIPNN